MIIERFFRPKTKIEQPEGFTHYFENYFENFTSKVPPINHLFDAREEIKGILSLPSQERKIALERFKDLYARQQRAWAATIACIERWLLKNPELPEREMIEVLEKFATAYGYPPESIEKVRNVISRIEHLRQRMKELRQMYPNDIDLIEKITGVRVRGKVKMGPGVFEIECSTFGAAKIFNRIFSSEVKSPFIISLLLYLLGTSGIYIPGREEESLPIILIIREATFFKPIREKVRRHERRHFFYDLWAPLRGEIQKIDEENRPWWEEWHNLTDPDLERLKPKLTDLYQQATNPEDKERYLRACLTVFREEQLRKIKDEILSYLTGSFDNMEYLQKEVKRRQWVLFSEGITLQKMINSLSPAERKKFKRRAKKLIQQELQKEFERIVSNAITAFKTLVKKGGYTREEARAVLLDKRLEDWPKTVRRLTERNRS